MYICMYRYMSHNLNSLGVYKGTTIGDIEEDTKSLDYGSYIYI